jgi:hypothetical protein
MTLGLWIVSETMPLDATSRTVLIHRYACVAASEDEALSMAKLASPWEDGRRQGVRKWEVKLETRDPRRFRVALPVWSRPATTEEKAEREARLGKPKRRERVW